jgi:hypothetical protein
MRIVVAVFLLLVGHSTAYAVPCPYGDVSPCLVLSPDGSLEYKVTVMGSLTSYPCSAPQPIPNSMVQIRFTNASDSLVCYCATVTGPRPRLFSVRSNALGQSSFRIAGGGCAERGNPAFPGPGKYAAEIFFDGVRVGELGIVSPDVVDNAGRRMLDSPQWQPAGSCAAGLADAVEHTGPIAESQYAWCSDLNCDQQVGISDAVLVTPYLAGALACSGNAGP